LCCLQPLMFSWFLFFVSGHSSVVENCVIEDYGVFGFFRSANLSTRLSFCNCTLAAIIGSNCVVSEGAYVEKKAALVADSVLLPGHRIPAGQVPYRIAFILSFFIKFSWFDTVEQIWGGSPAKFICDLDADTKEQFFSSVSVCSSCVLFLFHLHLFLFIFLHSVSSDFLRTCGKRCWYVYYTRWIGKFTWGIFDCQPLIRSVAHATV
jgi:hypothetical protein